MKNFVYVVCIGAATARNAVRGLIDSSFRTDAIRVEARVGDQIARAPVVQRRSTVSAASICAAIGALIACTAALIVTGETSQVQPDPWLVALRWAVGGAAAGAFVGAVGGFVSWRSEPALPPEVDEETVIIVGVETQPERAEEARRALEDTARTTASATDEPPERIAASVLGLRA